MIQKNRKSRIKDETLKAFILSALFLSLFFFNLNFISAEEFGYTYLEPGENLNQVTYLNYTEVNVNNSNFWAGYTPTTYYTYIKGLLDTAYDLVYCKLTGCTMTGNLITSGNITADTYFGDGSELTGIESEYNQTKKVCKEGCKYSTIQSAMDSITDASATNVYTVLLYPGIYNENVIQTSYVNLKGVGLRGNSIINISSGVGYNIVGQGSIDSITIQSVSQTDNSVVLYNQSSGKHHIKNCKLKFESSDNGRSGKWFGVNGGELTVTGNELDYDVDGNAGGLVLQNPIMVTNGELNLLDNEITMELEDTDDWLVLINSVATASTETHISNNIIEIEATNVGFNGLMTAWYEHGIGGEKFLQNNHVHLTGQAGGSSICVGAFFDSSDNDATLNGNSNWIDVAGCNINTGVTMNAGDTLVSSFDRVNAVTPISGAGNFNYVQSPSDGNFAVSGNITTADNSYSKLGNLWICNYTLTSNLTKSIEEGLC